MRKKHRFSNHGLPGLGFDLATWNANTLVHEARLSMYEAITPPDPHTGAVIAFGIAYETAILGWLKSLDQLRVTSSPQ